MLAADAHSSPPIGDRVVSATAELKSALDHKVVTITAVREQHANVTTYLPNEPADAVVFAACTEDVQTTVRICAAHGVPVIAWGAGTSLEGQVNAPRGGVCIDLSRMNRILAVNSGDLDCVLEPGVTRKRLNEDLRDQGLFFPIDPGADATLGGMVSTRASGSGYSFSVTSVITPSVPSLPTNSRVRS
jgi:D-lactate dehydrogenase (cytochrome)